MIKHKKSKLFVYTYILATLITLTSLSALILSQPPRSNSVNADTNVDVFTIGIPVACTLEDSTVTTAHTATVNNGTYTPNIGETTINVSCNDGQGYSIYAIGYSNNTDGNTNMIGVNTAQLIPTGTSTATGSNAVSNWAMKLTATSGTYTPTILSDTNGSYANYHVVPSTYTKVATYTSGLGLDTYSVVKTTYAVSIGNSLPADTYVGQVKYTLVHPHMVNENGCIDTPFTGYMQEITKVQVTYACDGTAGTLTDRRDNKTYTVAKLADGNLWMTENLAIDLTATSYNDLYGTGSNAGKQTNASNTTLGYLKGTTTGTTSDQYPTGAVSKAWTSSAQNYYSVPMIAVDSTTSGICNEPTTWCVDSSGNGAWSWDTVTPATINNTTSYAQGKLGVYYNYCAASAGSYCWGNGTSSTGSPSSDPDTSTLRDVTEDICPYGWRMPTSFSGGEYRTLYTSYRQQARAFEEALSTPLSGSFYGGKARNHGYASGFWSSTWSNSVNMFMVDARADTIYGGATSRFYGFSVRCLFDL